MRRYLISFLPYIGCAFFFSLFINLLQLSYLLYMRLLFDKVMISRSIETLVFLTAGVIGAYLVTGILEVVRSKLMVRTGVQFDRVVAENVFTRMMDSAVAVGSATHTRGLKDLNSVRTFLTGAGIIAFFDAPWVPIYLAIIFLFHPWLGGIAFLGALLLFLLVVAQELSTVRMRSEHVESSVATDSFLSSATRNAQSVHAMGMLPALSQRWKAFSSQDLYTENRLAARAGFFQSMAKWVQMITVAVIMSLGTYLVIIHETTIGSMIAASMIMGRALAPVLMLGNGWKGLVEARIATRRLDELLEDAPEATRALPFEEEPGPLTVENVGYSINGTPILEDVAFTLNPGEVVAVVGPSGAGKSTLARILLGLWQPESGRVRLGDLDIREVDPRELGRRMGYMPQDTQLFSGTVAENIGRLGQVDSDALVAAATKAGVHGAILELPRGYDTMVVQDGMNLSGGQRQSISLARALYGNPWIMVMDEPDSHLDQAGRAALRSLLGELKAQGLSVVVISHNQELAKIADRTLVLDRGRVVRIESAEHQALEGSH